MNKLEQLLYKYEINYKKNKPTIDLALTHRSFGLVNNERLEYLGDAVLELVITELLYKDYPEKKEGDLTSFRAALVKSETLAKVTKKLKLNDFILMSPSEEQTGGKNKVYILADVLEALIAAIHLIGGYEISKRFIRENLYYLIEEIVSSRSDIDPKSKLQEMSQEKFHHTPYYKIIKEEGPDHEKIFTVQCIIGKKNFANGTGRSKQVAEQDAAAKTLIHLAEHVNKM